MKLYIYIILFVAIIATLIAIAYTHTNIFENFTTSEPSTDTIFPSPEENSAPLSYIKYNSELTEFTLSLFSGLITLRNQDTSKDVDTTGRMTIQFSGDDQRYPVFTNSADNTSAVDFTWTDASGTDNNGKSCLEIWNSCETTTSSVDYKTEMQTNLRKIVTTVENTLSRYKYFIYEDVVYEIVPWRSLATDADPMGSAATTCFQRTPCPVSYSYMLYINEDFDSWSFFFQPYNSDVSVTFSEDVNINEIVFKTDLSSDTVAAGIDYGMDDIVNLFTSGVNDLETADGLVEVNNGVPCGWHYDATTGQAAGYFSETLNDPNWQQTNAADYATLKNYICPSYLPTCTGQLATGIVMGKCISLDDECNSTTMDNIIGVEPPDYSTSDTTETTEYSIDPSSIAEKNLLNIQNLSYATNVMNDIIHDSGAIEMFTNTTNTADSPDTTGSPDTIDGTCTYRIENKCYDQYVNADKLYYETGASIFSSVFPTVESDFLKNTFSDISCWVSSNLTTILWWKILSGLFVCAMYYTTSVTGDYRIKIFKSFIAFLFSEFYLLYYVYRYILRSGYTPKPMYS